MTKEQVIKLWNILEELYMTETEKKSASLRFKSRLIQARIKIKPTIEVIAEIEKEVFNIKKPFIDEQTELMKGFGAEEVKPNVWGISRTSPGYEGFVAKDKELQEKYKEELALYEIKQKEFNDILKEDAEVEADKLDLTIFPDWTPIHCVDGLFELGVIT